MDRQEFLSQVGFGAAAILVPACIWGLVSCSSDDVGPSAPANVDFTLDVSSGPLSENGGFIVNNGVVIARTNSGTFLAVSAYCTHQGTVVNYDSSDNNFVCPNHGSEFDSRGGVTKGPATMNLTKYNTSLSGTSLRVYS